MSENDWRYLLSPSSKCQNIYTCYKFALRSSKFGRFLESLESQSTFWPRLLTSKKPISRTSHHGSWSQISLENMLSFSDIANDYYCLSDKKLCQPKHSLHLLSNYFHFEFCNSNSNLWYLQQLWNELIINNPACEITP